jgi:hypothetical protein
VLKCKKGPLILIESNQVFTLKYMFFQVHNKINQNNKIYFYLLVWKKLKFENTVCVTEDVRKQVLSYAVSGSINW